MHDSHRRTRQASRRHTGRDESVRYAVQTSGRAAATYTQRRIAQRDGRRSVQLERRRDYEGFGDVSNTMSRHLEMLPLLRVRQTCRALRRSLESSGRHVRCVCSILISGTGSLHVRLPFGVIEVSLGHNLRARRRQRCTNQRSLGYGRHANRWSRGTGGELLVDDIEAHVKKPRARKPLPAVQTGRAGTPQTRDRGRCPSVCTALRLRGYNIDSVITARTWAS